MKGTPIIGQTPNGTSTVTENTEIDIVIDADIMKLAHSDLKLEDLLIVNIPPFQETTFKDPFKEENEGV